MKRNDNAPIGPLMNVRQVAKYLGCSEANIWRMVYSGLITCVRVGHEGGRVMFDLADVDAYIRARKVPATRKPRRMAVKA